MNMNQYKELFDMYGAFVLIERFDISKYEE